MEHFKEYAGRLRSSAFSEQHDNASERHQPMAPSHARSRITGLARPFLFLHVIIFSRHYSTGKSNTRAAHGQFSAICASPVTQTIEITNWLVSHKQTSFFDTLIHTPFYPSKILFVFHPFRSSAGSLFPFCPVPCSSLVIYSVYCPSFCFCIFPFCRPEIPCFFVIFFIL